MYSLGADGKTETDGDDPDDISNWHEPERWRNSLSHRHYHSRGGGETAVGIDVGATLAKIARTLAFSSASNLLNSS